MSNFGQFCLDIPRTDLYINGKRCIKSSPVKIARYLRKKLGMDKTNKCIFILTQTFIAHFYIEEYKKQSECEYITDDRNTMYIWVDTEKGQIRIEKTFSLNFVNGSLFFLLDVITLHIMIDLYSDKIVYTWIYDMKSSEAPKTIFLSEVQNYIQED